VSWDSHHSTSEELAAEAEAARCAGDHQRAIALYRQASAEEALAFGELPAVKQRTRGITAVSAVALSYKGREYALAERLAYQYLAEDQLPLFAAAQLRDLLQVIWAARGAESAGIRFVSGDVLVSVKGGEIIYGGAPLELIIQKIETIKAVLFRTVEMLLDRPLRKRGAPQPDVQSMFRPWLFQAPAGSYQFGVRIQEPPQLELYESNKPKVDQVTTTFFDVLRASANDPEYDLPSVVPKQEYREAFVNLSRNLAPSATGKAFERLEVHDASAPNEPVASFAVETRERLNAALKKSKPAEPAAGEQVILRGILRALHLDKDWLEIATEEPAAHVRIDKAGDVLDDVIGPMVNRRVAVTAVRQGKKHFYRDIELDE
jgi:hypothetical protein